MTDKCPYCQGTEDLLYKEEPLEKYYINAFLSVEVAINDGKLLATADSYDEGSVFASKKIRFCPMCGRSLSDK